MLNSITIQGRVVREVELRKTQSGLSTCHICVAVERDYANGGERETDFFEVIAFRQTAEFVSRFFKKGSLIVVQGSMQSRKFKDKNDCTRTVWELMADHAWFGAGKSENNMAGASHEAFPIANAPVSVLVEDAELENDNELPF